MTFGCLKIAGEQLFFGIKQEDRWEFMNAPFGSDRSAGSVPATFHVIFPIATASRVVPMSASARTWTQSSEYGHMETERP